VTESSKRPIGPYERRPVSVQPWDPRAVDVADAVIAIVRGRRPDLHLEHIGSTAVPGLAGKGIVDLGTEADPADIPEITESLYELGFGPQPGPDPWPSTRPMVVGSYVLDGREYRIHLHVHPYGGDLGQDLRFRDALRADPELVRGYAGVKQVIADEAGGTLDGVLYQDAKGGWIVATYDRLGIARPQSAKRPQESDR
jgi:dephospho-CoA kinase